MRERRRRNSLAERVQAAAVQVLALSKHSCIAE